MQNSYVHEFQRLGSSDRRALFVSAPLKISSDMTAPELAIALRKLAAKAATTDGVRLLRLASELDRPSAQFSTDRGRSSRQKVVHFRVAGKAYRERDRREMRRGLGLAGL